MRIARTVAPARLNAVIDARARRTYSYLGPAGTFTEASLDQVPEARGQHWRPVHNVGEALAASLKDVLGPGEGAGEISWYVTERSAAFDEVVRIMDPEVDPGRIRVDDRFILS